MTRRAAAAVAVAAAALAGEAALGHPHDAVLYAAAVLTGIFIGLALHERFPRMTTKRRSYTSDTGSEPVSTEGIGFELDGVAFDCHGVFDMNDLTDLAAAMMDADEQWIDPQALGQVGRTFETIMGTATYRQFRRHRREHHTSVEVVSQIMLDLIEDITGRDPQKRSASPAGPPARKAATSSRAASPSPASPRKRRASTVAARSRTARSRTAAADPAGIIPPDWAESGDVLTAPAPAAPEQGGEPVKRVINLGDPARTRVEALDQAG